MAFISTIRNTRPQRCKSAHKQEEKSSNTKRGEKSWASMMKTPWGGNPKISVSKFYIRVDKTDEANWNRETMNVKWKEQKDIKFSEALVSRKNQLILLPHSVAYLHRSGQFKSVGYRLTSFDDKEQLFFLFPTDIHRPLFDDHGADILTYVDRTKSQQYFSSPVSSHLLQLASVCADTEGCGRRNTYKLLLKYFWKRLSVEYRKTILVAHPHFAKRLAMYPYVRKRPVGKDCMGMNDDPEYSDYD
jgi:hypothetical protein